MNISEFELKVLDKISKHRLPEGNKRVAWVAAARRLEKKGLACKGNHWYITEAGREVLENPPNKRLEPTPDSEPMKSTKETK